MRVLYVDVDSLRPDHLGAYGYGRDTSPAIDRVAEDGVVFDRCYVSDSPCLPSRTAMASCRHGIKNGVVTHFGSGQWYDEPGRGHAQDPERPLSFRYLSENGLHTTSVSSFSKRHLAYHFGAGFRETIQPTASTGLEQCWDVSGKALNWLEDHATEDDWFLHVNYWDVHHPYMNIEEEYEAVPPTGPAPEFPSDEDVADQQGMTGTRSADLWINPGEYGSERHEENYGADWPASVEDRGDFERIIDGYDAAIRKVDREVERLLEFLEEQGVREETAVVITADHGDAFGEHGIYAEHALAHPPCQQVPLIVSWPGMAAGEHVAGQVYQFDFMATLVDLFGLDVPAGWDAEPFTPALRGEAFDGRDRVVTGHGIYTFSRAVYDGDWVYVRILHPGVLSVPGLYNDTDLPGYGLELLHRRDRDPGMTENLIDERPEKAAELRAALDGWVTDRLDSRDAAGEDPLARMAVEEGPFLYVDPESLLDLYEEVGRTDAQRAVVERAREFPLEFE